MWQKILAFLVTAGGLATWILSRFFTTKRKTRKQKERVDEINNEMAIILDTSPVDWDSYHSLNAELMRLNKKIRRLQTE